MMWPTPIGETLVPILVTWAGYFSEPLKWGCWVQYWRIKWGNYVAHSNWWNFGCSIGELGGVFKWLTNMGEILHAMLVNRVGYLCGPLKCV
jgi:hypothetical protein